MSKSAALVLTACLVAVLAYVQNSQSASKPVNPESEFMTITRFGAAPGKSAEENTKAINAAFRQAVLGGKTIYAPSGTFRVNHVIIPTDLPDSRFAFMGEAGTVFACTETGGADCFTAISSAFSNPHYSITNLDLEGPDGHAAICSTAMSGNGLRISGMAAPLVRISNVRAIGFCGIGKAGIWLDNTENGSLRDSETQFDTIGLKLSTAPNAMTIDNLLAGQNKTLGVYCDGCTSDVFTNVTVQSNQRTGIRMDGGDSNTFNSPHFENNNTSHTMGEYGLDLTASKEHGSVLSNVFNAAQFAGTHDTIHMTGVAGHAVSFNVFNGGLTSSGPNPLVMVDGPFVGGNTFTRVTDAAHFKAVNGGEIKDSICSVAAGAGCSQPGTPIQ